MVYLALSPKHPPPPLDPLLARVLLSLVATLHPSTLIAPVPYACTLAATVPSRVLRARMMGSHAGLSAVP